MKIMAYSIKVLAAIAAVAVCTQTASAQPSTDQFEYDALGRLVRVQRGEGALSKYNYDKADNRSQAQVQRQFDTSWLATSLNHQIGYADASGGWAAETTSPVSFLTYGPYTTSVPVGERVAVWRIMVDVTNIQTEDEVVTLDVYDATANEILTSRTVKRKEFMAPFSYQIMEVPFSFSSARAGHAMEFRTYFRATSYVKVERIGYY
ncbi:hypothetical protein MOK15_15535 [Sphingobium sp. BYY-5]|uniref:hypothetical protein n=1 Tax=Sphingobium sp. BYY-5 TaxID=2926400 RepID=UPI001FA79CC7|nr:hypothetical protein [Sphingobium sp. BYY-5]MCI4590390.1 hypothetical protein [Sphingobium sp. BYY-5]MCI4591494.1 hypothetical protein [Sphingobium sp. BYY-5]